MTTLAGPSSTKHRFIQETLHPPRDKPRKFAQAAKFPQEPVFDPSIHLQLESPTFVRNLSFRDVPFPPQQQVVRANESCGFAYTPKHFRILSDQGLKVLRSIVDFHKTHHLKTNDRNSSIRGLAYLSQFVSDLTYAPPLGDLLSQMAGEPLGPQSCVMNHAHTNVGAVGAGTVDKWHVDSVDYVVILMISDTQHMQGGQVQVLQKADATGDTFAQLQRDGVPDQWVSTLPAPPAGYGLFLRGSKLLHAVTSVVAAREPRHSVILPWSSRNVFGPDLTRLDTLRYIFRDPPAVASLEYARHKAWRVSGQMKYLIDHVTFENDREDDESNQDSVQELANLLQTAADELVRAKRILLGEVTDNALFLNTRDPQVSDSDTIEDATDDVWMVSDISEGFSNSERTEDEDDGGSLGMDSTRID